MIDIDSKFERSEKGKWCGLNTRNVMKEFIPSSSSIADATKVRDACESYCYLKSTCWGCSVHCGNPCQWNAISECGSMRNFRGIIEGDVTKKKPTNRGRLMY